MQELFGICALAISVGANVPYVYETIKGKVRPERISWLLWTMLGATYFLSAVFEDGAVFFTAGELIGPVVVLILALKFGVGGKSKMDLYLLAVAMIAFSMLFVTEGTLLSLFLAIFVDGIGAFLTIRKLLIDPASESKIFWGLNIIASTFAVLSLTVFNFETLLFPLYVFTVSTFIFIKTDLNKEKNLKKIQEL